MHLCIYVCLYCVVLYCTVLYCTVSTNCVYMCMYIMTNAYACIKHKLTTSKGLARNNRECANTTSFHSLFLAAFIMLIFRVPISSGSISNIDAATSITVTVITILIIIVIILIIIATTINITITMTAAAVVVMIII